MGSKSNLKLYICISILVARSVDRFVTGRSIGAITTKPVIGLLWNFCRRRRRRKCWSAQRWIVWFCGCTKYRSGGVAGAIYSRYILIYICEDPCFLEMWFFLGWTIWNGSVETSSQTRPDLHHRPKALSIVQWWVEFNWISSFLPKVLLPLSHRLIPSYPKTIDEQKGYHGYKNSSDLKP